MMTCPGGLVPAVYPPVVRNTTSMYTLTHFSKEKARGGKTEAPPRRDKGGAFACGLFLSLPPGLPLWVRWAWSPSKRPCGEKVAQEALRPLKTEQRQADGRGAGGPELEAPTWR